MGRLRLALAAVLARTGTAHDAPTNARLWNLPFTSAPDRAIDLDDIRDGSTASRRMCRRHHGMPRATL